MHHWVVVYMHKDGQLLPEFGCFSLHCCVIVAFCTGLLAEQLEWLHFSWHTHCLPPCRAFSRLYPKIPWGFGLYPLNQILDVCIFYYCVLQLLESKYVEKTSHPSWSLPSSSQLFRRNPLYCSWDDSCATLRQRQCTWTMCDPKTCWCSMEGDDSLLQRLEHVPGRFLSCLCFLKRPMPWKTT